MGRARLLPDSEAPAAERALQSNYGLGRRLYTLPASRVDTIYVEVTPAST